ncbi:MAG TPA: HD family phosphohydrolase [Lachnospiraceae bacterium]|nr:HD family phosphohydrolase [Lachnospiraceae bacterium]
MSQKGEAVEKKVRSFSAEFCELIGELRDHKDYVRLKDYIQHGNISTYTHCLRVAKRSFDLARKLGIRINEKEMLKGAMLHDYFLYDWHDHGDKLHGYHHPHIALKNARRDFGLTEREQNIIQSHMWPLTITHLPRCREAVIVCIADKICSIEETFKKDLRRLKELNI